MLRRLADETLHVRLFLGFILALVLSILPMPELISDFRPPWVLLLVLYIEYFLPGNFKLTHFISCWSVTGCVAFYRHW